MAEQTLLAVRDLKKHFPIVRGFFNTVVGQVRAVDGVSFSLYEGECLGLVGESGSGKTTVGRTLLRAYNPTAGEIGFRLENEQVDIARASEDQLKTLRRHMQMIFQDPYASLNPRMTVFDIIGEPLLVNGVGDRRQREERVRQLLAQVGLDPQHMQRYPHAFSGGQRQRIGIARALALRPRLLMLDEPVSALDVSVRAQILNLLMDLQDEFGITYIIVSHDLGVLERICDRIAIMYLGRIVELAQSRTLFANPEHPYTRSLISAIPIADPRVQVNRQILEGDVPDPANAPSGCKFSGRCPLTEQRCIEAEPDLVDIGGGHLVRCHLVEPR